MRSLLAPAIALLDRLRYPQKFALISLIFALPLALAMFLLIDEINNNLVVARAEADGVSFLRTLRQLREHLPQHDLLAYRFLQGDTSLKPQLDQARAQIDTDMQALVDMDRRFGARFGTTRASNQLVEQWQRLKAQMNLLTPNASMQAHVLLMNELRTMTATVGDTSSLILDPQLDSYYMMDAVLLKLPEQQALIGQMLMLDEQLPRSVAPTARDWAQMTLRGGSVQASLASIKYGIGVAARSDPNGAIQRDTGPLLQQSEQATTAFLQSVDQHMLNVGKGTEDAFFELGQQAIKGSFALWDRSADTLEALLQARINDLTRKVYATAAFAAAALVLVFYLLIGFYRSVMRTVSHLELAAQRLVSGDATEKVALSSRDELSDVATSFNQIATAMLAANAQRTAVVENAVDGIMTLDAAGNVQSINAAAEAMFGVQAAQCTGQSVALLLPEYMRLDRQDHTGRYELTGCRSDGSTFPVELALNEVFVQGQPLIVGMTRDLTERKQDEAERERLQQGIIRAQAEALKELATPLIPVTDRTVVMPLIGSIDSQRAQQIVTALLHGVEAHQASVAIIDITGVPVVDTHVAQTLLQAAQAIELLGAKTVLTGIRPEVAATLVTLGVSLGRIVTCSSLQSGITFALAHESSTAQKTQLRAM